VVKSIIVGICFALVLSASPSYGQSAMAELKADPAIAALGVSDERLEVILDELAAHYIALDKAAREREAMKLAIEILKSDSASGGNLRGRLMSERAAKP